MLDSRPGKKRLNFKEIANGTRVHPYIYTISSDILSVSAQVIPPRLLLVMRCLGIAGVLISAAPNVQSMYYGITGMAPNGQKIPWKMRKRMMISGGIGLVGSAAFLAAAIMLTPAALPIGTLAAVVGFRCICEQYVYEEWDGISHNLGRAYDSVSSTFSSSMDYLASSAGQAYDTAYSLASSITSRIGSGISRVVASAFSSAASAIKSTASSWASKVTGLFSSD